MPEFRRPPRHVDDRSGARDRCGAAGRAEAGAGEVGTANSRLLRWAGAHADVVGLTGDDVEAAARPRAERLGLSVDELLAAPFVLMGSEDEILAAIAGHERRWGVTRFVVREEAVDAIGPIVARLAAVATADRAGPA